MAPASKAQQKAVAKYMKENYDVFQIRMPKGKKFIEAQDRVTKKRIKTGIEGLTFNPPKGDIKIIQGYNDNRQRLRIGKYRIIYKYVTDNTIEILHIMNIDSRGDIYKR